jgi:hypothetical protein
MVKKHILNNLNCVPMPLRNASETPGSNPFKFGPEVLIAAERVDHARSAVFCAQSVLCHLKNRRYAAVARRQLSCSLPAALLHRRGPLQENICIFLLCRPYKLF